MYQKKELCSILYITWKALLWYERFIGNQCQYGICISSPINLSLLVLSLSFWWANVLLCNRPANREWAAHLVHKCNLLLSSWKSPWGRAWSWSERCVRQRAHRTSFLSRPHPSASGRPHNSPHGHSCGRCSGPPSCGQSEQTAWGSQRRSCSGHWRSPECRTRRTLWDREISVNAQKKIRVFIGFMPDWIRTKRLYPVFNVGL